MKRNVSWFYHLGNSLVKQARLDDAAAAYRRAIELNPFLPWPYHNLGGVLRELGHLSEAASCFQKAVELDPYLSCFYKSLGETLVQLGRIDEAIAVYQKATELKPNLPSLQSQLQKTIRLKIFLKRVEVWANQNFQRIQTIKELAVPLSQNIPLIYHHFSTPYETTANQFFLQGEWNEMNNVFHQLIEYQRELAGTYQLDQLGTRFLTWDWTAAIGHNALVDYYVKMGILGWLPEGIGTAFFIPAPHWIANPCFLRYWNRYLPVISEEKELEIFSPFVMYLENYLSVSVFADGQVLHCNEAYAAVQKEWEAKQYPPLLTLESSEFEAGLRCLEELGVPPDSWFVCLHVREPNFHRQENDPSRAARNAEIESYILAIESIVARGGWVIRMGDAGMKLLSPMPKVIDYAHSQHKSDWMDVFLWASCRFFIGTISGPAHVPPTFGVPCVLTNWVLAFRPWFGQDIFIPKLYWSESENRHLTFLEALDTTVGYSESLEHIASKGITLVDNTPEEINSLVVEMLDRLDGIATSVEDNDLLQARFNQLAKKHPTLDACCPVGRDFLRKYNHLLPEITAVIS